MVDMFFYRDPQEIEDEQKEAAAAKLAAAQPEEGAPGATLDWDPSAPLNPGLAAADGEDSLVLTPPVSSLETDHLPFFQVLHWTGLRMVLVPLTGPRSRLLVGVMHQRRQRAVGIKCTTAQNFSGSSQSLYPFACIDWLSLDCSTMLFCTLIFPLWLIRVIPYVMYDACATLRAEMLSSMLDDSHTVQDRYMLVIIDRPRSEDRAL